MIETRRFERPRTRRVFASRLISAPSNAIFSPPLLLRPFDTAYRINPLAERTVDVLDRTAPDLGMARRYAGTQRFPQQQFVGLVAALLDDPPRCRHGLGNLVIGSTALGKPAGERPADFLMPLIGKGIP